MRGSVSNVVMFHHLLWFFLALLQFHYPTTCPDSGLLTIIAKLGDGVVQLLYTTTFADSGLLTMVVKLGDG